MSEKHYYSIRMHASFAGAHVSGAERIVSDDRVSEVVNLLLARARSKGTRPDQVRISVDDLGQQRPPSLAALDLVAVSAAGVEEGRSGARRVLRQAGVTPAAIDRALHDISSGAHPSGGNMRGAMVIDARSGARLEHDHARGIRATRFDWSDRAAADRDRILISLGLAHFRTSEALALATKIAHGPGVLAELCWSDDPDYTAGYAASLTMGYVRFPVMKEPGNAFGGRAIFIRDTACLQDLTAYLEEQAVLIDSIGGAVCEADLESYLLTRTGAHVRT